MADSQPVQSSRHRPHNGLTLGIGPPGPHRLAVLASGRGSNLQAILDAIRTGSLSAELVVVLSNVEDAPALRRAEAAGVLTAVCSPRGVSRDEHDHLLAVALQAHRIDLICLAGYMRLLGTAVLDAFTERVLNIHPSLLPAFPGLHAQRQALDHGVTVAGATVHVVTPELDAGPIVLQEAVPVLADDSVTTLSARILEAEHRIYPAAIARVLSGAWRIEGRRFVAR